MCFSIWFEGDMKITQGWFYKLVPNVKKLKLKFLKLSHIFIISCESRFIANVHKNKFGTLF